MDISVSTHTGVRLGDAFHHYYCHCLHLRDRGSRDHVALRKHADDHTGVRMQAGLHPMVAWPLGVSAR